MVTIFNDESEGSSCELEDMTVSECELNGSFYRRIIREAIKKNKEW